MKEIIELHEKILAAGTAPQPEHPINFSRAAIEDDQALLSPGQLGDIEALQAKLAACLPEDADFYAFIGGANEPLFDLAVDEIIVGHPEGQPFVHEESLLPQLERLDWDALRKAADARTSRMEETFRMLGTANRAPRSAKQVQKEFKEAMKEYIRDKRADASRIFLLCCDQNGRLVDQAFSTADEFRDTLPRIMLSGAETVTVVAFGKPLPVEKVDALLSEAHRKVGPLIQETLARVQQRQSASRDGMIEVEASVAEEGNTVPELPATQTGAAT